MPVTSRTVTDPPIRLPHPVESTVKEAHKRNRNPKYKRTYRVTHWPVYDRSLSHLLDGFDGDIASLTGDCGYDQSTVENTFYRYKTIIGRRLRARGEAAREVEAAIACKIQITTQ
jgi:hypothetical protein